MKLWIKYIAPLVLSASTFWICFTVERHDFHEIITLLLPGFLAYLWINYKLKEFNARQLIIVALIVKTPLLFTSPNLSDDVYRFIWDGRTAVDGNNPYLSLPSEYKSQKVNPARYEELFGQLNSKEYYTVYPPFNQAIFAVSSALSGDNMQLNIFWLKFFIFVSEVLILFFLPKVLSKLGKDPNLTYLYVLNPLVNLETIGNLHFEGMMFLLLLVSIWFWLNKRKTLSALSFSLAIGTKLIPLIFLPFLLRKLGWKEAFRYYLTCGLFLILMFLPFANTQLFSNLWSSVDLYFQNFEFNASVFYLVREVGFQIKGYDIIQTAGPWLSIFSTLIILLIAFQNRVLKDDLFGKILIAITIYYLLATTVHPWYIISILGISTLTNFRYPVVWSFLAIISYTHYSNPEFTEKFDWILLEYILILAAVVADTLLVKKNMT